jgi:hypothetical protein
VRSRVTSRIGSRIPQCVQPLIQCNKPHTPHNEGGTVTEELEATCTAAVNSKEQRAFWSITGSAGTKRPTPTHCSRQRWTQLEQAVQTSAIDQLVWLLALSTGGTKLLMVSVGAADLKGALSQNSWTPPANESTSSRVLSRIGSSIHRCVPPRSGNQTSHTTQ